MTLTYGSCPGSGDGAEKNFRQISIIIQHIFQINPWVLKSRNLKSIKFSQFANVAAAVTNADTGGSAIALLVHLYRQAEKDRSI